MRKDKESRTTTRTRTIKEETQRIRVVLCFAPALDERGFARIVGGTEVNQKGGCEDTDDVACSVGGRRARGLKPTAKSCRPCRGLPNQCEEGSPPRRRLDFTPFGDRAICVAVP